MNIENKLKLTYQNFFSKTNKPDITTLTTHNSKRLEVSKRYKTQYYHWHNPLQLAVLRIRSFFWKFPFLPLKPLQNGLFKPFSPNVKGKDSFIALGDSGHGFYRGLSKRLEMEYIKQPFASILMLGDHVYEDFCCRLKTGSTILFNESIYQPFKNLFKKKVKFFPVLGNHDVWLGNAKTQLKYWNCPHKDYQISPLRDAKGLLEVNIFAVDTTTLMPTEKNAIPKRLQAHAQKVGLKQLKRLEFRLKKTEEKYRNDPFKSVKHINIVMGHYPLFMKVLPIWDIAQYKAYRSKLLPIFKRYNVHLFLGAHHHFYEKLPNVDGTMHVTSGGGGGKLSGTYKGYDKKRLQGKEISKLAFHFMRFKIHSNRLEFKVIDDEGKILDQDVIIPN